MNTFTKTQRLLTKKQYDHVFANAKKMANSDFTVLYRENDVGYARLGLALSKKMISKAHDRNRVKRLIRETFRTQECMLGIDIIVLARPGVAKIQNSLMIAKLSQAWNKLSVTHVK